MIRIALTVATAMFCTGCGMIQGATRAEGPAGLPPGITIERDAWGVPSVRAMDEAGVSFGLAYAMAEDGMPVIQELYAAVISGAHSGTGAAPDASSAAANASLAAAAAAVARAEYSAMPAQLQAICASFADGLNHYMRSHPGESRHIVSFEPWMVVAFANHALDPAALESPAAGLRAGEAMVWAIATAGSPALLLASGREAHPYEMDLRDGSGWQMRGLGLLGLAWPLEGHNSSIAYAHARVRSDSAHRGTGSLTQLHAMSHATDTAVFIAARSNGPLRAATVLAHASGAVLITPDGQRRSFTDGSAGFAGDREVAAEAVLRAGVPWTLETLADAAFDRRVYGADAEIAALIDEWEQAGARNPDRAAAADDAVERLRDWDRMSRAGSSAMTLYASYRKAYENDSVGALPRFRALESVIGQPGAYPPRIWEESNRILSDPVPGDSTILAIPVAGAPARFGIMFAYDGTRSGQHYVRVAEGGTGRGASVLSRGQSARAVSRHSFDQAALFSTARLKPAAAVR